MSRLGISIPLRVLARAMPPVDFEHAWRVVGQLIFLSVLISALSSNAEAQASGTSISIPAPNQALQGQVTITGSTGSASFGSAEIAFAYSGDETNTWFSIASLSEPVTDGALTTWDTTNITDGAYVMRLRVFSADGSLQDATVGFEIANYSSIAAASPVPSPTGFAVLQIPSPFVAPASPTPEPSPVPTPSPLPPNPMSLSAASVYGGLARGALFAIVAIFALAVILLRRRP